MTTPTPTDPTHPSPQGREGKPEVDVEGKQGVAAGEETEAVREGQPELATAGGPERQGEQGRDARREVTGAEDVEGAEDVDRAEHVEGAKGVEDVREFEGAQEIQGAEEFEGRFILGGPLEGQTGCAT